MMVKNYIEDGVADDNDHDDRYYGDGNDTDDRRNDDDDDVDDEPQ